MKNNALRTSEIINIARSWINTPYRHQGACKGVGCDCLGLIRGIWLELFGKEVELPPAYSPDWAEANGQETLLKAARRHLIEINPDEVQPSDVLLFRMASTAPVKHCAVLSYNHHMIHAYSHQAIVETAFTQWWRRRLAATFRFPD